jgi:hypothetical protein
MDRTILIKEYRDRIERGDRIKLTTEERAFLVEEFIEALRGMTNAKAIRARCQEEIALLEAGYGAETNSTTNYLSKYRKAIEEAVASGRLPLTESTSHHFSGRKQATGEIIEVTNHLAWELMRYDNEVYARNRRATNVANNQRQDEPQPFVPDRFLEKATELLEATEAETLAVGIAAVTGRRHTEVVVSGSFSLTTHPYLLQFEGQLKKEKPIAYPIVTLLPAKQVLAAINRFRALPPVQELAGRTSEDRALQAFRARVNSRVKLHFQRSHILPLLPGFNSVSVHRLRAAYARMAVYFWLPNQGTNEHRFLQFYLGHVTAAQMRDAPNASATTHYFGYRLETAQGKEITARGIKLMGNPALPTPTQAQVEHQQSINQQLLQAFDEELETEEEDMTVKQPLDELQSIAHQLEILPDKQTALPRTPKPRTKELAVALDVLSEAAVRLGLTLETGKGKGYQALLQQVLQAVAAGKATSALSHDVDRLSTLLQDAVAEAELRSVLVREVASLKQELHQVLQERDGLRAELDQLTTLKHESDQLKAELALKTERLNQFLQLASGAQPHAPVGPVTLPEKHPASPPSAITPMATGNTPARQPARPKRSPEDRIQLAVQALFHHNEHCSDPSDRWFISGNILAEMSRTNPATRVKPWLEAHPDIQQAIDQHNQEMNTTAPHHNRRKHKDELRSIYDTFEQALADS